MTPTVIQTVKGLDIPISGEPKQEIEAAIPVDRVAILGVDFVGMKPTMRVREGDSVELGQPVFEDKKTPGVLFTAPASGTVEAVVRGPKRRFDALVIRTSDSPDQTSISFRKYDEHHLGNLPRDEVREVLVQSGLWTALRTRPYGRTPAPESAPKSLFITAMDTNPHAPSASLVLDQPGNERYFVHGVQALSTLTDGEVYVCRAAGKRLAEIEGERIRQVAFGGPHPAGLPGTHIHFLDPVDSRKTVWHIGYQDVIAIGRLFLTGQLSSERIISLAGPGVKSPRLLQTRIGASIDALCEGQLEDGEQRVVSGSVLSGRKCNEGSYLGRFHLQIAALPEHREREFLGWASPGEGKFSVTRAFASAFLGKAKERRPMSTTTNGSRRALVPIGLYEKVMPLDIIATPLLKSLLVGDTDTAQALGCLELEEEDLALCTFVCPGKNEYGPLLRESLTHIEREG